MKIKYNSIGIVCTYIFYKIILDIIYVNWVYPVFGYSGFSLEPKLYSILISYFLLIIMVISLPKSNKKVSYLILNIHLVIMYVPMLSLYALGGGSFEFTILVSSCFVFQTSAIRLIPTLKIKRIKSDNITRNILNILIFLNTMITYGYLFKTQNFNWSALNFNNIYQIRSNLSIGEGVIVYLITWQYRIINPFVMVNSFVNNKKLLFLYSVVLQIVMYLILPFKEILFSLGLIFLVLFFYKTKVSFSKNFVKFISVMSISSVLTYISLNIIMPFALFTRLIFEPAKIKFQYFIFFMNQNKLLFSEGLIGKLFNINYPYEQPIGFIVYNFFEPLGKSNSNTGYIAYAFANAGILGMIIMSILFIVILLIIDGLSKSHDKMVILSLLIYPMIILNDGDLLTLLLTGGLFLLIVILFIHKNESVVNELIEKDEIL